MLCIGVGIRGEPLEVNKVVLTGNKKASGSNSCSYSQTHYVLYGNEEAKQTFLVVSLS